MMTYSAHEVSDRETECGGHVGSLSSGVADNIRQKEEHEKASGGRETKCTEGGVAANLDQFRRGPPWGRARTSSRARILVALERVHLSAAQPQG